MRVLKTRQAAASEIVSEKQPGLRFPAKFEIGRPVKSDRDLSARFSRRGQGFPMATFLLQPDPRSRYRSAVSADTSPFLLPRPARYVLRCRQLRSPEIRHLSTQSVRP